MVWPSVPSSMSSTLTALPGAPCSLRTGNTTSAWHLIFLSKYALYVREYLTKHMYRQLAGISPLLEVEDMVKYTKPDWKCVFTYVQSFYRRWGIYSSTHSILLIRFRNIQAPGKIHTNTIPTHNNDDEEDNNKEIHPEESSKHSQVTVTNTPSSSLSPTSEKKSTPNSKNCRSISLCTGQAAAVGDKEETRRKYSFSPSIVTEVVVGNTRM